MSSKDSARSAQRALPVSALIESLTDAGSWVSWDEPADVSGLDPAYAEELAAARAKCGSDESIITGAAMLEGRPVALVLNEFGFLGGSIGRAAAARLVAAIDRATAEGLPLIGVTGSGGTRMQEGTPAFVTMADIARAVQEHRQAGLPYLVYLQHPTTGGVFASWGSLADVTLAAPGALIGFLGPKVFQLLRGEAFPAGVQQAENLLAHGIVDAVVADTQLKASLSRALSALALPSSSKLASESGAGSVSGLSAPAAGRPGVGQPGVGQPGAGGPEATASLQRGAQRGRDRWRASHPLAEPQPLDQGQIERVWQQITATRAADRPGLSALLEHAEAVMPLAGTGRGERDEAVRCQVAHFAGQGCVLIGQDRSAPEPMGPAGLRGAQRAIALAGSLGLPVVTVIDTAGAQLSPEAEQSAMAGEIARTLAAMMCTPSRTIAVMLGQGTGGGALALLPADEVIALGDTWISPLPPEGASAIMHGDVEHAAQLAARQQVDAQSMERHGLIDHLLPPAAQLPDFAAVAARIGASLRQAH